MEVAFAASAAELEELARTLLEARLEHNVIATVLAAAAAHGEHFEDALFASVTKDKTVIAAALRTPPRQMLATTMDEAVAAALMEAWLARDPAPPGVAAPQPAAGFIAAAFARASGAAALHREMAAHHLKRVIAPARPASGRLREAGASERALLVEWTKAFGGDTGMYAGDAEQTVERSLGRGRRFIWEDGGEAVSMVGISPAVAGVVRIGPVYTPRSQRGRGYASSAVAAVSVLALERGARECMLFTDLANPTSNKIYAALGYERFGDWAEYGFSGGGGVDHDAPAHPPGQ